MTHTRDHSVGVSKVAGIGLAVNVFLAVIKVIGGIVGGSQALVADGVHSVSDFATDIAVIVGARFWSAPADTDHPYGHGRIETLVSLFIGVLLGAVGTGLCYNAVVTLASPQVAVPGWSAFVVACLSIAGKEALYQWTTRMGARLRSSALMANAWHHRSDALSSIPVAIAVLANQMQPDWTFLDNVATVVVSMLILYAAWGIARPALAELLDTGAGRAARERILTLAITTPGVCSVHALRTRHIGTGLQVDIHVQVDPEITVHEGHAIAHAVRDRLYNEAPDVVDALIHIEPYDVARE